MIAYKLINVLREQTLGGSKLITAHRRVMAQSLLLGIWEQEIYGFLLQSQEWFLCYSALLNQPSPYQYRTHPP